jgi:hypothetical protein
MRWSVVTMPTSEYVETHNGGDYASGLSNERLARAAVVHFGVEPVGRKNVAQGVSLGKAMNGW